MKKVLAHVYDISQLDMYFNIFKSFYVSFSWVWVVVCELFGLSSPLGLFCICFGKWVIDDFLLGTLGSCLLMSPMNWWFKCPLCFEYIGSLLNLPSLWSYYFSPFHHHIHFCVHHSSLILTNNFMLDISPHRSSCVSFWLDLHFSVLPSPLTYSHIPWFMIEVFILDDLKPMAYDIFGHTWCILHMG